MSAKNLSISPLNVSSQSSLSYPSPIIYDRGTRLAPQSHATLRRILSLKTKPLGELLQAADLISSFQLEIALSERFKHPNLRIGEILAHNGVIQPKTADFFARDLTKAIAQPDKDALGYYLQQAGILNETQIKIILDEQLSTGVRFGTVAVFQGFLKSTTLDFFLDYLFPEEANKSPFINM